MRGPGAAFSSPSAEWRGVARAGAVAVDVRASLLARRDAEEEELALMACKRGETGRRRYGD